MDGLVERFYLPIGIICVMLAGSVSYEVVSFETISVQYGISEGDSVYRWWSFTLKFCTLFGLLPAFLLKMFDTKKSMILGGIFVTTAHVLALVMITYAGKK